MWSHQKILSDNADPFVLCFSEYRGTLKHHNNVKLDKSID